MDYLYNIAVRFVVAALLGGFVPVLLSLLSDKGNWRTTATLLGALSLVGAAAGIAGGMSRTGVVGDIVPAFLGLLGAVAIYLFGVDRSRGVVVSFGAVALSISLVSGYALAAQYRNSSSSDFRELRTICAEAYTNVDLLSNPQALEFFEKKFDNQCDNVLNWRVPD